MTATVEADARTGLHAALVEAVGDANVFTGAGIEDRYKIDLLQMSRCEPAFLVRPASTAEVSAVMRAAKPLLCQAFVDRSSHVAIAEIKQLHPAANLWLAQEQRRCGGG